MNSTSTVVIGAVKGLLGIAAALSAAGVIDPTSKWAAGIMAIYALISGGKNIVNGAGKPE